MPMAGARDQEGRALDCRIAARYSHVRVRMQVAVHVLSMFRQAFSQTELLPNSHSILCQRTVLTIRFIFRRALHHSCIQHDRCSSRIHLAKPPTLHVRAWGSHQGKEAYREYDVHCKSRPSWFEVGLAFQDRPLTDVATMRRSFE